MKKNITHLKLKQENSNLATNDLAYLRANLKRINNEISQDTNEKIRPENNKLPLPKKDI